MKFFLLSKLLFLAVFAYGQITPRIIDKISKEPISGANITLHGSTIETTTNYLGYFQLDVAAGSKLTISHPSFVTSEVIVPAESATFLIALNRKHYNLGGISIDLFPMDPETSTLTIENEVTDSKEYTQYESDWSSFYIDYGNAIINHPDFQKLEKSFMVNILFTVDEKGKVENISVLNSDASYQEESDEYVNILKSSLVELNKWIPATLNKVPISQSFELEVSRNKEVFMIVEEPASPIGGYESLYNYINSNLQYPHEARKVGIEGKLRVSFVVDKDGGITDIEVVKGLGFGCDLEAIRLLKEGPKWYPPYQRGKPVKQRIILPITFNLAHVNSSRKISFKDYLSYRIRYPREARKAGVEGTLYAVFEISESYEIKSLEILNDIGFGCGAEVKMVINSLPTDLIAEKFRSNQLNILPVAFGINQYPKKVEGVKIPEGKRLEEVVVIEEDVYRPLMSSGAVGIRLNSGKKQPTSIKDAIENDPAMQRLSLVNKNLDSVDPEINKLRRLLFLDLEGNNITQLPDEILELDRLQELYLPDNRITNLPEEFHLLSSLKVLGLASNQLSGFPSQLTRMSKLEVLDLSGNDISEIPKEVGNLKKLRILVLNNNNIKALPSDMSELKKLEKLFLIGNELSPMQIEVIKDNLKRTDVIVE
ncbi:TonB family protein [Fulvivirga ulvae]|uniref:TonB family protein n=1 Tax=Fulvivirga ulvae TaxID=2904245 RepID=UPI001F170244|nr:TonB family protein [Fulvivirga ulvae]UII29863.1 TonB family protein [Fulvivirga ulvae]